MQPQPTLQPIHRRTLAWTLACLVLFFCTGCPKPLSPEHTAAVAKMQGVGGKVVFADGGYRVNMRMSNLEDGDIPKMNQIENLKIADLTDTRVSDKGLVELAKIKTLNRVMLTGTLTTIEGREQLKKSRPDIVVIY